MVDNHAFASELGALASDWDLDPPPELPLDRLSADVTALAEPVEEILAFSNEDTASPPPVDVIPENVEDLINLEDVSAGAASDQRTLDQDGREAADANDPLSTAERDLLRLRGGSIAANGEDATEFDDEDDEIDEDDVELGVLRSMPSDWDVDFSVGKVGGLPRYLDPSAPVSPENVACRSCGSVMPLLMQVSSSGARHT